MHRENHFLGAVLLTVGWSYVRNDVTLLTLLDRMCACSYENLPIYHSYRVSNTAPWCHPSSIAREEDGKLTILLNLWPDWAVTTPSALLPSLLLNSEISVCDVDCNTSTAPDTDIVSENIYENIHAVNYERKLILVNKFPTFCISVQHFKCSKYWDGSLCTMKEVLSSLLNENDDYYNKLNSIKTKCRCWTFKVTQYRLTIG